MLEMSAPVAARKVVAPPLDDGKGRLEPVDGHGDDLALDLNVEGLVPPG